MAVPTVLTDLTVSEATNSPPDSESVTPTTRPSDYLRAHAAFIRRMRAQGAALASAATVNIGAITDGEYIHITGVVTITAFDIVAAGVKRTLVFDGILTLTHNATSLILPGGQNIVTVAGDVIVFVSEGSGNWRCKSPSIIRGNASQTFSVASATTSAHAVNLGQGDGRYAALAGLSTQTFSVATATTATHAVTKAQLDAVATSNGEFRAIWPYTASTTYSKPAGLVRIKVTVIGGGAGGRNGIGASSGGGGGGAGATSIRILNASSLAASETVTVGAGGAAITAGGNSAFGAFITANGGGIGDASGSGGGGGAASGGDINFEGGGGAGGHNGGATIVGIGGAGGNSSMGGGGRGTVAAGGNAGGYGGGGAGGGNGTSNAGGNGKGGIIIIEEFF